jgi:hypothetical protein
VNTAQGYARRPTSPRSFLPGAIVAKMLPKSPFHNPAFGLLQT